jgi:Replication-relaxation
MDAYNLETFKALDRYRYLRSNFVAAFHGGSQQHRRRDLGTLRRRGLLSAPEQQKNSANYRYTPRVYELSPKGKAALIASGITPIHWVGERQFWHQLMVADIVMSFEIACKSRGLRFRHRKDIIGTAPLTFPTNISHQFPKHSDHYSGVLQPDELFAINNTYFILEADRQNEPITRPTLATSSYLRKILQYRAVLRSGSYKELIPNMLVLNITTSATHADNIMAFMEGELAMSSSAMMFMGIEILGSRESYPQPLIELLDLPFRRVGHDNFIISQEVYQNGRNQ